MKPYYHKMKAGNFGDDLNAELWEKALPGLAGISSHEWLIGIGTILDHRVDKLTGKKLVMGSGYRPGVDNKPKMDETLDIQFVRGPLTVKALGLPSEKAITDPAVIVPDFMNFTPSPGRAPVGFAPHVHSLKFLDIEAFCKSAGIKFIDTRLPPEKFIPELKSVDRLITEAMHGAITADAFGIPWVRVKFLSWQTESESVADFKWSDWGQSMQIETQAAHQAKPLVYRNRGRNLINKFLQPANCIRFKKMIRACSNPVFSVSDAELRKDKRNRIHGILEKITNSDNG